MNPLSCILMQSFICRFNMERSLRIFKFKLKKIAFVGAAVNEHK